MSYDFFPKGVGSKSADVGLNFAASWNTNGTPARKTEAEEAGDYLMQHFQSLMNKKGKSTNNKSLNESNCDKKLHNSLPPGP